jgi:nucleoid DNA-binding protein
MYNKLTIQDLVAVYVEKGQLQEHEALKFVTSVFQVIREGLERDGLVKVRGLGTFKIVGVSARESVSVSTGARVVIQGHDKITFTPDAMMKELVNKPFSQFETVILNEGVDSQMLNQWSEKEQALLNNIVEAPDEPEVEAEPDDEEAEAGKPAEKDNTTVKPAEETAATANNNQTDEKAGKEKATAAGTGKDKPATPAAKKVAKGHDEDYFKEEVKQKEEKEVEKKENSYWWAWALLAVAACVVSFAIGYIYGTGVAGKDVEEVVAVPVDTTAKAKADSVANDSVAPEKPAVKDTASVAKKPEVKPKEEKKAPEVKPKEEKKAPEVKPKEEKKAPEVKPKEEKKAPEAQATADWKKYDAMDARLQHGAYGIVGTDRELTVKQGQTITSITRSTLGPGMECYIEVYNGLKRGEPLKAGQKIKIPKVETKKKLMKN